MDEVGRVDAIGCGEMVGWMDEKMGQDVVEEERQWMDEGIDGQMEQDGMKGSNLCKHGRLLFSQDSCQQLQTVQSSLSVDWGFTVVTCLDQ